MDIRGSVVSKLKYLFNLNLSSRNRRMTQTISDVNAVEICLAYMVSYTASRYEIGTLFELGVVTGVLEE